MNLGVLQINFNEGTLDAVNDGVRADYKLYDIITNYFPPEEPAKSPAVPIAFSVILLAAFGRYFLSLVSIKTNLTNITFWGLVFTVNYFLVLCIIMAFWIKINLVNTLWILVVVIPITIFTMNKGIDPKHCTVGGFENILVKSAGKGKNE